MASVHEALAREIIANNGHYHDDPVVVQVIKYENAWGGESWAILYEQDVKSNRYTPSEYVINPEVVWERK